MGWADDLLAGPPRVIDCKHALTASIGGKALYCKLYESADEGVHCAWCTDAGKFLIASEKGIIAKGQDVQRSLPVRAADAVGDGVAVSSPAPLPSDPTPQQICRHSVCAVHPALPCCAACHRAHCRLWRRMLAVLSTALQGLRLLPWMRYIAPALNDQGLLASGEN